MIKRRLLVGSLVVLLLGGAGFVVAVYPMIAAAVCPWCYGLSRAGPGVYVGGGDGSGTPAMVDAARQRVRDYLGDLESDPRLLICLDADCYRRIGGGGEKGQTLRSRVIAVSPDGANEVIVAHEMVHAEVFHRLGGERFGRVPRWFHEGLSVVVSRDERYLPQGRCPPGTPSGAPPKSEGQDFYRDSACAVHTWLAANGGRPAALDVIRRVAAGEPFDTVVVT